MTTGGTPIRSAAASPIARWASSNADIHAWKDTTTPRLHPGVRRPLERLGFRCTSRFRGVTCSDLGSGQGFTVCAEGANAFSGGQPTPCRARPSSSGGGGVVPPKPRTTPTHKPSCSPSYSPCVPNVPYDLDCADIGFTVTVIGPDVYRLDGDGDSVGCESS